MVGEFSLLLLCVGMSHRAGSLSKEVPSLGLGSEFMRSCLTLVMERDGNEKDRGAKGSAPENEGLTVLVVVLKADLHHIGFS